MTTAEHIVYDAGRNLPAVTATVIGGGIAPDIGVYLTIVPQGFMCGGKWVSVDAKGTAYRIPVSKVINSERMEMAG